MFLSLSLYHLVGEADLVNVLILMVQVKLFYLFESIGEVVCLLVCVCRHHSCQA